MPSADRLVMMRGRGLSGPVVQDIGGGVLVAKGGGSKGGTPTPPTPLHFDFEDGAIPALFTNAANFGWQNNNVSANAGTRSMRSSNGPLPTATDRSTSSVYIIGNFEDGDFSFAYRISSEAGFDFGYVYVDGALVTTPLSGNGVWEQSPVVSLTAGVHIIQFVYVKDNSAAENDDFFYIDDIITPPFTSIGNLLEYFPSGVPAGWVNDATYPWDAGAAISMPFSGVQSPTLPDSASTSLTYTSPATSPAGVAFFIGAADSNVSDTFKFFIDGVEVYSDSDRLYDTPTRGPKGAFHAVSAGSHEYKWTYTTDAATQSVSSRGYVNAFYEPSMGV